MGREVKVGLSIIAILLAVFLYVLFDRLAGRAPGRAATLSAEQGTAKGQGREESTATNAFATETEPARHAPARQSVAKEAPTVLETRSSSQRGHATDGQQAVPAVWESAEEPVETEIASGASSAETPRAPSGTTSDSSDHLDKSHVAIGNAALAGARTIASHQHLDNTGTVASVAGPPSYDLDAASRDADPPPAESTRPEPLGASPGIPDTGTVGSSTITVSSSPNSAASPVHRPHHTDAAIDNPFEQSEAIGDRHRDKRQEISGRYGHADSSFPRAPLPADVDAPLAAGVDVPSQASSQPQQLRYQDKRYSPTDVPTPDAPLETLPSDAEDTPPEPYVPSYRDREDGERLQEYRPGPMRYSGSTRPPSRLTPYERQHALSAPSSGSSGHRNPSAQGPVSRYEDYASSRRSQETALNHEFETRPSTSPHVDTTDQGGRAPRYQQSPSSSFRVSGMADSHMATDHFARPGTRYTVQTGDSFWTIAQRIYGDGAFFRALQEHNRKQHPKPEHLRPGDVIETPPLDVLVRTYPQLCPKARSSIVQPAARRIVAPSVSANRALDSDKRIYVVEEGDTLFDIARYELGDAGRWTEIYEMNRDVLGDEVDHLRPGTRLLLPALRDRATLTKEPPATFDGRY